MRTITKYLLVILLFFISAAQAFQVLFYTDDEVSDYALNNAEIINIIQQHYNKITILAPQVYQIDKQGLIWGSLDSDLLKFANAKHLNVMPLITNTGFSQNTIDYFLNHTTAQTRAIAAIIALCDRYHYYGVQLDFENIPLDDKIPYSEFFKKLATQMHHHHYVISVAIVPSNTIANQPLYNKYNKWIHANWNGAYDLKALGKEADFVSLMTYDCHTSLTTPGPIAPYYWVKDLLIHTLKDIPANKISLGIPVYSGL